MLIVALLPILSGCGAGDDGSAETTAGASAAPVASLVGAVDLRIGELDGAEPYVFGRIAGLARSEDGRIVVADRQADEVRVFSPTGDFLFAIGRSGGGPGEFRGPCCLAFGPEGLLWVRDGGNARYQAFQMGDTSAAYVGQRRMAHADVNFAAPITFDTAGRLIDIGHRMDSETGRLLMVRFHLDSTSAAIRLDTILPPPQDSVGMHPVRYETNDGSGVRYFWQPYGPAHLVAHSHRGGWAEALSSRYAIDWHLDDGSVLRIDVPGEVMGPRLSAAEQSAAEQRMKDRTAAFGMTPADLPFDVPERKPPLRDLHFDRAGRLWVERAVPDGAARRADVYDRSGSRVATVHWPTDVNLRVGWIGPDGALGVTRGELGVEQAVRLSFEPADTAS